MARRNPSGFTLIEIMVVIGLIGILAAMAVPRIDQWSTDQRVKAAARSAGNALSLARGEAIRTGNIHVVFFQTDALGATLTNSSGTAVPILVLDDGLVGSADQNCRIDAGEPIYTMPAEADVNWGVSDATTKVPADDGTGTMTTGSTFTDGGGNDTTWVLFRPQGIPLGVSTACVIGGVGSGAGGVYVTNGRRDHAVIMTPLGAVRAYTWDKLTGQWNN